MDLNQLQAFCKKVYPKMWPPFTYMGYTYATNGSIMVRVPQLEGVTGSEVSNCKIAANYFGRLDFQKVIPAMVEIPEFHQPERSPCTHCNNAGNEYTCTECGGEGKVRLKNNFHEYVCECLACHGEGKTVATADVCPHCDGVGSLPGVAKIAVGEVFFGSQYLTVLKEELPGVKIAPLEKRDANYFKWEGGEGLLMPMRP